MASDLISVGIEAPDFTLLSADEQAITLSDYRNQKNVILYFMREFT